MRNPPRKAFYCIIALAVAAALMRLGFGSGRPIDEHLILLVPALLGIWIAPFAFVILIQALFVIGGRARLLRGEGVIARWRILPGEWKQFREIDRRRSAEHLALGNDLWVRRRDPEEPVEVIVGRKSAIVDGSYHTLNRRGLPELRSVGWLEGPPACLEFSLLYPRSRYGGNVPTTLRIPVPPSARADAFRVHAHYAQSSPRSPPLALRNPALTYRLCAFFLLTGAAMGGAAYAVAGSFPEQDGGLVPMSLMIGGIGIAAFGIFLATATYWMAPRT